MNGTVSALLAAFGRLLISSLFLYAGVGKLLAPAATKLDIAVAGLPFPDLAYLVAVIIEVGFASALLVGYRTRTVAAVLAMFTVATAFAFHFNLSDQDQLVHFLKNLAITGGLLQIVAAGGGAYSLDARSR
ncbi:MAG: DoxX family protein [Gammaproteobacteria bacterium]